MLTRQNCCTCYLLYFSNIFWKRPYLSRIYYFRTILPDSEQQWNEKLMGYYNFCVKCLREIPLNTAVMQYILQSGQVKYYVFKFQPSLSYRKLSYDDMNETG